MSEEIAGWFGDSRSDGLRVAVALGGIWVALPTDGRPPIIVCPCCDREMRTNTAVKFIADAVYPL